MTTSNFASFLYTGRSFMNDSGVSAQDFGKLVGCSGSFIRAIERELQNPSRAMAEKMLDVLNADYIVVDSVTLQLNDGQIFRFNSPYRGRNKAGTDTQSYQFQINDLETRVTALENRLNQIIGKESS